MGMHGEYLIRDAAGDPFEFVPEVSRRARGVPVWAVMRALGRSGLAALVDGYSRHAVSFAAGIAGIDGATDENYVVFSQVCDSFGSDEARQAHLQGAVAAALLGRAEELLDGRPDIRPVDILAEKLPA